MRATGQGQDDCPLEPAIKHSSVRYDARRFVTLGRSLSGSGPPSSTGEEGPARRWEHPARVVDRKGCRRLDETVRLCADGQLAGLQAGSY